MLDLLASPFTDAFDGFACTVQSECFLCSPFITLPPVRHLLRRFTENDICHSVNLHVLTDISAKNIISGATDLAALRLLTDTIPSLHLRYLPRVHAKVFLAGRDMALIGSANLTDGGASGNYEYGVRLRDTQIIERIWQDMGRYAGLGASVTAADLSLLQAQVLQIRQETQNETQVLREKARTITQILRSEVLTRRVEDCLAEMRVTGRTIHAIFCDTLLYLLGQRDMAAEEMAEYVQKMHPDICDDTEDRMINGQSFGKKWKHHLRTARGTLQRKGLIRYHPDTDLWSVCSEEEA